MERTVAFRQHPDLRVMVLRTAPQGVELMDHDREIISLAGETVALQAIVSRVLHEIGQVDPRVRHAIRVGFEEAANQIDAMAIAAGGKNRPEHFAKAIKLLEVLRLIVLKRDEPTHSAQISGPVSPAIE